MGWGGGGVSRARLGLWASCCGDPCRGLAPALCRVSTCVCTAHTPRSEAPPEGCPLRVGDRLREEVALLCHSTRRGTRSGAWPGRSPAVASGEGNVLAWPQLVRSRSGTVRSRREDGSSSLWPRVPGERLTGWRGGRAGSRSGEREGWEGGGVLAAGALMGKSALLTVQ